MYDSVRRFSRAQRSDRTAKTYGCVADRFLAFLGGARAPKPADVEHFLDRPLKSGARQSAATRNQALAALRAFACFALKNGIWTDDPTRGLSFQREPQKDPAVLHTRGVHAFFRAVRTVSSPEHHARDCAILALLFTLGLRVSELTRTDVSQIDLPSAILLAVRRKGGRVQDLPLAAETVHLLDSWLARRAAIAAPSESALFVSRRGTRLSVRSIERLFERIRKHVATAKHVTPHSARHSFITIALSGGAEISVVSRVAGHASVTTTMRYRHLLDGEPRQVVTLLGEAIPPELRPAQARVADEEVSKEGAVSEPWSNNASAANDTLDDQDHLDDIAS